MTTKLIFTECPGAALKTLGIMSLNLQDSTKRIVGPPVICSYPRRPDEETEAQKERCQSRDLPAKPGYRAPPYPAE